MRSRQSHVGALCPVCKEPIATHEVRPFNPLAAARRQGLRPAYNRTGRNCFDLLVW